MHVLGAAAGGGEEVEALWATQVLSPRSHGASGGPGSLSPPSQEERVGGPFLFRLVGEGGVLGNFHF